MVWGEMSGADRAKDRVRAALRSGRPHHAYLLVGPDMELGTTFAKNLAAAILCEAHGDDACGACRSCQRVDAATHSDLTVVAPDGEGATRLIKIEKVREMIRGVALFPLEGERKVVLILEAHRMNQEAQNALLKTLEEPPDSAMFVLVAATANGLLPTVRSRCVRLVLGAKRQRPGDVEAVAGEVRRAVREGFAATADLAERWAADKGEMERRLDALSWAMRDVAERTAGEPRALDRALAAAQAVIETRRSLSRYANARLALDALFLRLSEEKLP